MKFNTRIWYHMNSMAIYNKYDDVAPSPKDRKNIQIKNGLRNITLLGILKININIKIKYVYLPHSARYCDCPPKSQHFIWTPFFFTILTFKPIVGAVSIDEPFDSTCNKVVFPLDLSNVRYIMQIILIKVKYYFLHLFSNPTSTTSIFLVHRELINLRKIWPMTIC